MNLWQSESWANLQKSLGRETFVVDGTIVLKKKLPFGYCFFEVQRGNPTKKFWKEITPIAIKNHAVFCRIAPDSQGMVQPPFPVVRSHGQHFPSATRIITLTPPEEEIFAQFSQTCRRHIRKAEKSGVIVHSSTDLQKFANLSMITAKRDGFSAHSSIYFQKLFHTLQEKATLLVAEKNGIWLSAGIFIASKNKAYYYYGASSNEFRELNAPTLLQWEAMKWVKSRGCTTFDLLGITPENHPNHPLSGVTQFKRKFGGTVHTYAEESNIIFSRHWYRIYRLAKFFRKILKR